MMNIIGLFQNLSLSNLDLLSVGITIAAIAIIGFAAYISDRNNITYKSFFLFCIVTIVWSFFNYISYQTTDPILVLWLLRVVIFLGAWHSFSFFQFFYVFPNEKVKFPRWYFRVLIPYMVIVSLLTLTPLVFSGILQLSSDGSVSKTIVEKGMFVFAPTVIILLIVSIIVFLKKLIRSKRDERKKYFPILVGTIITFILLFTFNLVLPALFYNVSFIPLGALFIFPFIFFTTFSIYKNHLFNVKVAAIALVAMILTIFSFVNIVYAHDIGQVVINITFFISILIGSFILIRSILREIEQREKIEKLAEDLKKANLRLTDLDRQKSEFVSFATHQLRAPLTAMKGYASLLLEGDMGPINDKAKEGINRIFQSTNTLVSIVDDYLNVSRIELGTMKYAFETINLKQLVEDVIGELKPNIDKSGVQFSFEAEDHGRDFRMTADRDKLKQVVANIIDNSIKYTPKGSVKVDLFYEPSRHKFVLRVKDTGVGIASEVLPRLFQKFSRAQNANKVNIRGTGLGLFVAKEMIEIHHGTIRAESEGEGKGSTFIVELEPLAKA